MINKKPTDPITFEEICEMFPDSPIIYLDKDKKEDDFVELKVAPPPRLKGRRYFTFENPNADKELCEQIRKELEV